MNLDLIRSRESHVQFAETSDYHTTLGSLDVRYGEGLDQLSDQDQASRQRHRYELVHQQGICIAQTELTFGKSSRRRSGRLP